MTSECVMFYFPYASDYDKLGEKLVSFTLGSWRSIEDLSQDGASVGQRSLSRALETQGFGGSGRRCAKCAPGETAGHRSHAKKKIANSFPSFSVTATSKKYCRTGEAKKAQVVRI